MAIESEHSRFQDERQDSRFEMIQNDQQKVLLSISESKARLEQFFSFFGEFEKQMYARIDDKLMPKLNDLDPLITDIFVRQIAMVRFMQKRHEIEAEIQNIIQGK